MKTFRRTSAKLSFGAAAKGGHGFTVSVAQQGCPRATLRQRPGPARLRVRSDGFTIVELMIATLVFSTILLLITVGVLYFTHTYYSSINRATTQNTARTIISSVSQGIQFSGTPVATTADTGSNFFCAGGNMYIFKPGVQYQGATATATNPGLYVVPSPSGCASPAGVNYNRPDAQQLLGKGMRIADFTVTSMGRQLYTISLTLAYGDNDLLCAPQSVADSCNNNTVLTDGQLTASDVTCRSQTGSQFCAVSSFNTTVQQRVQGS